MSSRESIEEPAYLKLEDLEKVRAEFNQKLQALKQESDEEKRKRLQTDYDAFRRKYFRYFDPDDENPDDNTDHPPPVEEDIGRWQLHKGGNKDPHTWKIVPMLRNPGLFKIVDDKDKNIIDLFHTEAGAKAVLAAAIKKWDQDHQTPEPCPPGQHRDPASGNCVPDTDPGTEPTTGETPYPAKSPKMASTQRGPTTRHYASGKADDQTIEKNCKEIEFENYQAVVDITNDCEWEHNDNFSIKLGGTHMGSGWFDNSLEVFTGKTGLGYEPDHPKTHLFVEKGPAVGDTRGKRFKYACTYFTATNKTELWTNMGDGWKKQLEGTNVGNFKPMSKVDEFQLRIDGFKSKDKPPTIHSAFVTAI